MFKIKNSTIHCSRGDSGTITLRIPITDANDYIKYTDSNSPANIYWYDSTKKKLYDSNYEESSVSLETLSIVYYQFVNGDVVKLNIYKRNGYDIEPLKTKSVTVESSGNSVDIPLTEEDTTFGEIVNKATPYWYDITLNNDQTVVCYNEDGAKEFIMYPAKGDDE